jgi:hypothetical protein
LGKVLSAAGGIFAYPLINGGKTICLLARRVFPGRACRGKLAVPGKNPQDGDWQNPNEEVRLRKVGVNYDGVEGCKTLILSLFLILDSLETQVKLPGGSRGTFR